MRQEWDARINHDYRFWMGDGASDDATMWAVGQRDFNILFAGEEPSKLQTLTALELGCGVGRLMRPAAQVFKRVIGVDVSQAALTQATKLLSDLQNKELILGNGIDLSAISDASIDYAYSFASLGNMPLRVIATYLRELARVVKLGGKIRLQLYLGREQGVAEEDTIAIRSLDEKRFASSLEKLGLRETRREELKLPFEVSDYENGAIAYIVELTKASEVSYGAIDVLSTLAGTSEIVFGEKWEGSQTEYLMAVSRAQEHLEAGKAALAREALEFAVKNFQSAEPEVKEILAKLQARESQRNAGIEARFAALSASQASSQSSDQDATLSGDWFTANVGVIERRFPALAQKLKALSVSPTITFQMSSEGQSVLLVGGTPLDNLQKPRRAADAWVERAFVDGRHRNAERFVVFGFAGGFHLEALMQVGKRSLYVIEPSLEILRGALSARDLRPVLQQLEGIFTSCEEFRAQFESLSKNTKCELLIHPQSQTHSRAALDEVKGTFWSERGLRELRPSFAVVGPIYGGTLPILGYTCRALSSMNQRVQSYDLSCFAESYHSYKKFLRTQGRVDVLQGYQVETLSQLVLEGVNERPVDIVICMAQAPLSPRVLNELRSRGIITVLWFVEDGKRFTGWKLLAPYFDYIFVIQRDGFPAHVEAAGAGRSLYLPVGCDPAVHAPMMLSHDDKKRWGSDCSFVGAGYHNRQQMFAALAGRDFKIWGTEWPSCEPFKTLVQEEGRRLTPAEYVKIFNATKVNINLHSSTERDGVDPNGDFINPRTFELAAAGAFQLVDERSLLAENFDIGSEVVTFGDRKELLDKLDYYVANPDERQKISAAARARALKEHTYEQRLRQMLGYIYADRYEQLRSRISASPWAQTLESAKPYEELRSKLEVVYERGEEPTLEGLINDIENKKGKLTPTEMKLLFLHHVRSQISVIETKRNGTKS